MSDFVLRPAYLRDGKFVPDRQATPVEMDWPDVMRRFAPSQTPQSLLILRQAHPGTFIGTRRRGRLATTFAFDSAGRSRSAAQVMKRDPSFATSIIEVFLVERTKHGAQLQELGAA